MVGYGTIKTRRETPFKDWRKEVDGKLDNDHHQLRQHERELTTSAEFQRVILRALKGILLHEADGNSTDELRKISIEIDTFLINR
jgi:hypothetical protein